MSKHKERSAPAPQVVHIGVSGEIPGGIAQVLREYSNWEYSSVNVRLMASTHGKGDRLALARWMRCLLFVLWASLMRRGRVAIIVHVSQRGSFVREGSLVVLGCLLSLPAAIQIHGSGFIEFAKSNQWLVRGVLRSAQRVFVLTSETADAVRAILPDRARSRVRLVSNAVAVPDSVAEKEPIILFAGEVGVRKGVDVLIKAWQDLSPSYPAWQLLLAGPTHPTVTVPEASGTVHLGSLPRDKVLDLESRAAIAVLPSRGEALPMFLLESMARKCAVVSTPVGQIVDLLRECGSTVPVGDSDALGRELELLMKSNETRLRRGLLGRQVIEEKFAASSVSRVLETEWLELFGGRNARQH